MTKRVKCKKIQKKQQHSNQFMKSKNISYLTKYVISHYVHNLPRKIRLKKCALRNVS